MASSVTSTTTKNILYYVLVNTGQVQTRKQVQMQNYVVKLNISYRLSSHVDFYLYILTSVKKSDVSLKKKIWYFSVLLVVDEWMNG